MVSTSSKRLRSLELQDVESGVVVGEVHHALRIDKAVCGLDDLRPVGTRVEHALWIGRHEEPSLARLERILDVKDPDAGIVIGGEDEAGALEGAAACRQPAAANGEAALLPLGLMVRAKRMQQGTRDMLIARDGEELVCPKGTICGRMTRDANDQITDGDFAVLETCVSPDGQRYVCACCERTVAVREHFRWRVHLRRGWIR